MSHTPALITGYYHCDNCERTVERVQRTRGYWLCDACWAAIVPPDDIAVEPGQHRNADWHAATQAERERIAAYGAWMHDMRKRKPLERGSASPAPAAVPAGCADEDLPLCACGRAREPMRWIPPWQARGLFGGPYRQHCPVCECKLRVEAQHDLLLHGVNPDWDDEQWLDSLEQIMPAAFALGVLPDYWFRLRYPALYEVKP